MVTGNGAPPTHERTVLIQNERGLHARASARFVETAGRFEATVTVSRDALSVSALSIMGLLMLTAAKGCDVRLAATGPEAVAALDALQALVDGKFGEEA